MRRHAAATPSPRPRESSTRRARAGRVDGVDARPRRPRCSAQVSVLREEVRAALSSSVEPLRRYLATYEIYVDFLRLDVDKYVQQAEDDFGGPPPGLSEDERNELNKPDLNVNELRRMAEEHLLQKSQVEDSVPEVIDVGAYHVSCQKIRRMLADKHQETATKLLDLVARKTGDNATDASGEFQKIMDRCARGVLHLTRPWVVFGRDRDSIHRRGPNGPKLDKETTTSRVDGVTRD